MENLYIKETGKKGLTTYKYKEKYIYSYYDPFREAEKYVSTIDKISDYAITCCGADYVNSALLKKNVKLIISYDPLDFEKTLNSDKIKRVKTTDEIESILLNQNIHAENISLIIWQPLIETNPDLFIPNLKSLKKILFKSSISANTAKGFGFLEIKNYLLNLITIQNINIINKANTVKNNPALLISSGASLADNLDFIKNTTDKLIIFALPSALPYLAEKKIKPDFVIAVDPGYGTYYHLSKYTKEAVLLSPLSIHPSIFKLKNYINYIFSYDIFFDDLIFNNIEKSIPEGSVTLSFLRLLPKIGFKEVILIGQDFGFKNGRNHINEGFFEREFLSESDYFSPLEDKIKKLEEAGGTLILNINGKKIRTNTALKLYYEHFIKQDFKINIFLTEDCYNPISDKIKKIDIDYINKNYKNKADNKTFQIENINIKNKRNIVIDIISDIYKMIKNNNITEKNEIIINKIFIDKKNLSHINKLKKLLGINK